MFRNHPAQYHVKFRKRYSRGMQVHLARRFSHTGKWSSWQRWEGEPGSPIVDSSFDDYRSARKLFDAILESHKDDTGFEIAIFYDGKIFYQH